jgi:hypothetical protein
LYLLEKFKVFPLEKLTPLIDRVRGHLTKDKHLEAAAREYAHLDNRIRYIVYGHTHDPKQAPIRVVEDPEAPKEHIYVNTGTWRARHFKSTEGLSFTDWKTLSYVIFYKKEERGLDLPSFETWTGTLKNV